MDSLVITGVPPYDGEYPLDFGSGLTNRELHTVKQISGVRAGELTEAMQAGDYDVVVAFAAVLLARAGHQVNVDALWDAQMGAIDIKQGEPDDEGDARPPDSQTSGGEPSKNEDAAEQS